jgi:uncharacterized protein YbjT (DUF2867 family)
MPDKLKVIIFGATGMVGQGVLIECLGDPDVDRVLCVGRSGVPQHQDKLHELVVPDLFDLSLVDDQLSGYDACFFCLGVSAARMTEADYRRMTFDLTLSVARTLVERNPSMTFVYVSGVGTDSTENGRAMWARVKGATENALLKLPFKGAFMFRPGVIQPVHGVTSRTALYRLFYTLLGPFVSLARTFLPNQITTTERIGKAMLAIARRGATKQILEPPDIEAAARSAAAPANP